MTTQFTEENFSILYDEQKNVVELRYQGVNAQALADLSARIDALSSSMNGELANVTGYLGTLELSLNSVSALAGALTSDLSNEENARLAADSALGEDLFINVNNLQAAIDAEVAARASALLAEAAARGAAITDATGVLITEQAAMAASIQGLATSLGDAQASIVSVQDAISTETATRSSQFTALQADLGDTQAAILQESVVRSNRLDALASQIETLAVSSGTSIFIQPDMPSSGMVAGDAWYDTDDGYKAYRYDGTNWIDVTDIRIVETAAAISLEQTARANGDIANAELVNNLTSVVNVKARTFYQNDAPISDASYTLRVGDLWFDTDGVPVNKLSRWNGSAWQSADNADIAAIKVSLTEEANTRATADGDIRARYGVRVNANGHVAGFGLIVNGNAFNSTVDSEFVIDATRFKVYNGAAAVAPFQVSGNTVYMQNVVIQDALIQNLTVGKLTSGTFNNDFNVGTTGRVRGGKTAYGAGTGFYLGYSGGAYVFDIGTTSSYLRWTGSGLQIAGADITLTGTGMVRYLGTNIASTYIDWYGPTGVTVNDANAKFFIKKTGEAQFIGRIRGEFEVKAWGRIGCNADNTTRKDDVFNVASVTRLGEGQLQVTFYTPLANNNYAVVVSGNRYDDGANPQITAAYDAQTTGFKIITRGSGGSANDAEYITFVVFGSNVVSGSNVTTPEGGFGGGTVGGGLIP